MRGAQAVTLEHHAAVSTLVGVQGRPTSLAQTHSQQRIISHLPSCPVAPPVVVMVGRVRPIPSSASGVTSLWLGCAVAGVGWLRPIPSRSASVSPPLVV